MMWRAQSFALENWKFSNEMNEMNEMSNERMITFNVFFNFHDVDWS